jgi:hypothetical protein
VAVSNGHNVVVITADGGKKSKKGDKLPQICRLNGITYLVLSLSIHHKPWQVKLAAFVLLWPDIEALFAAPAGSGFKLQFASKKGGALAVRIIPE